MLTLSKKDIVSALITGFITGFSTWRIFVFLGRPAVFGLPVGALVFVIPLCWLAGVWFGYFLGQWVKFFNQFGKFVAVGFTNAGVDFGVLYLLIALTKEGTAGVFYTVFKSVSFLVALCNSYFWNKVWAFEADSSGGGGMEFTKFLGVTVVTFLINVSVASFVVNFIPPLTDISAEGWAGAGAIAGAAVGLTFSFVGYKLLVFKK